MRERAPPQIALRAEARRASSSIEIGTYCRWDQRPNDAPEAVLPKHANPPWSESERILALELYLRRGMVSKRDPELIALSERLRDAHLAATGAVSETFRNPTGVSLKLANFAALDPEHVGVGMQRGSRGDVETWNQYSGDTDALASAADRALVKLPATNSPGSQPLFPLEESSGHDFQVSVDSAVRTATRREAALVQRFGSWLRAQGHEVGSHRYELESSELRSDLVDTTTTTLWEAKSEVGRNAVRLAIGQLFDYRRHAVGEWSIGVLLPRQPHDDLIALCAYVGASVAWQKSGETTDFTVTTAV
ncbi:hypothetical protein [Ilumatobacter coccineus]|uniref:Uncharacterized protein n=1 Tax=Ilumatobacter coccineus (strain NBRC 103263 / KCTC 29153 / YM16-304) TaxID=1313172 RepID=A0A6C7E9P6_ILUCY|nr:hypothetical protein [Ilumatobacter coccineus]BAN04384.1 hypothetical protein YM304_40700 [Ilumatobacter coccineus YM16-304]